jgi:hypothetical protein
MLTPVSVIVAGTTVPGIIERMNPKSAEFQA